jgi:hypothetical protein
MALVLGSDLTGQQLAGKIAALAAGKKHRLAPYQVDGEHPVTPAAADGIIRYLERCQDRTNVQSKEAAMASAQAPAAQRPRENFQDILAGFYATPSATGNNDLDFWKVTEGKKPGIRFVKRVIGGGSAQVPATVTLARPQQTAALQAILRAGIGASSDLYADKELRCTDCGRQLTDVESRAARKGPVCRSK